MTRRELGRAGAILAVAFVLVLAVPGDDRALALYAFLLLAGALALAALVALIAARPPAADARLEGTQAARRRAPAELEAFEQDVRGTLRTGAVDDRLQAQMRAIAAIRLARGHGVDSTADPAAAAALIGEGPLWRMLAPSPAGRARVRVTAAELAAAVDQLERLR